MVAKDRAGVKDYVLRLAREQGVKFIRLWFTDILGFLKSFSITFEELGTAFQLKWSGIAIAVK
jgi:glutamine synthetase